MHVRGRIDDGTSRSKASLWLRAMAITLLITTVAVVGIGLLRENSSTDMAYGWAVVAVYNLLYARLLWRRSNGKKATFLGTYSMPPDGNEFSDVTDNLSLFMGAVFAVGTVALLWV